MNLGNGQLTENEMILKKLIILSDPRSSDFSIMLFVVEVLVAYAVALMLVWLVLLPLEIS